MGKQTRDKLRKAGKALLVANIVLDRERLAIGPGPVLEGMIRNIFDNKLEGLSETPYACFRWDKPEVDKRRLRKHLRKQIRGLGERLVRNSD